MDLLKNSPEVDSYDLIAMFTTLWVSNNPNLGKFNINATLYMMELTREKAPEISQLYISGIAAYKFENNGLYSKYKDSGRMRLTNQLNDQAKFKVPSLRNIELTAPYMHDGRFNTLKDVLDFYSEGVQNSIYIDSKMQYAHQGGVKLSEEEKEDVIAFLNTLTDSVFISNPEFQNPF